MTTHIANKSNPHGVTAAQVKAVPLSGGTMTGQLKFDTSDGSMSIPLRVKMSNYEAIPITVYEGGEYGVGMAIQSGGTTILGGGESARSLMGKMIADGENVDAEHAYVAADTNVYIVTGCQTIDNRKTFAFKNNGELVVPGNLTVNGTISGNVNVSAKTLVEKFTTSVKLAKDVREANFDIKFTNNHTLYFGYVANLEILSIAAFNVAASIKSSGGSGVWIYFTPSGTSFTGRMVASYAPSSATSYPVTIYGIL